MYKCKKSLITLSISPKNEKSAAAFKLYVSMGLRSHFELLKEAYGSINKSSDLSILFWLRSFVIISK
jgi:hypothetical protein